MSTTPDDIVEANAPEAHQEEELEDPKDYDWDSIRDKLMDDLGDQFKSFLETWNNFQNDEERTFENDEHCILEEFPKGNV